MKHKEPSWNYIYIDKREEMIMSGWKLYIAGYTVLDGQKQAIMLRDIIMQYNLTTKIATEDILRYYTLINLKNRQPLAWSSMIIYLTEEVFASRKIFHKFINEMAYKLSRCCNHSMNTGLGMRVRTVRHKSIYARYDLDIPVDAKIGVTYEEYLKHYSPEQRANIPGNKDILEYLYV